MPKGIYERTEEHNRRLSEVLKGRQFSEESKRKMSESHKGMHHSEETKKKISKNSPQYYKGKFGKNHNTWKGENAHEGSIHIWNIRHYGQADHCELCGKSGNGNGIFFQWANLKNHKYSRDIEDYIQLCNSCHQKMDNGKIDIEMVRELRKQIKYIKIGG